MRNAGPDYSDLSFLVAGNQVVRGYGLSTTTFSKEQFLEGDNLAEHRDAVAEDNIEDWLGDKIISRFVVKLTYRLTLAYR